RLGGSGARGVCHGLALSSGRYLPRMVAKAPPLRQRPIIPACGGASREGRPQDGRGGGARQGPGGRHPGGWRRPAPWPGHCSSPTCGGRLYFSFFASFLMKSTSAWYFGALSIGWSWYSSTPHEPHLFGLPTLLNTTYKPPPLSNQWFRCFL